LAHEKLPDIVGRAVKAGVIEQGVADYFVNGSAGFYKNYTDTQTVRDEAVRSASFAAMTLMLAAEAKGLVSGPMIGFDPAGVKQAFDIADRYVPVMLLTVGHPAPGNWPRKPRLAVDEVLAFNHGRVF
jgi:nitroreductase